MNALTLQSLVFSFITREATGFNSLRLQHEMSTPFNKILTYYLILSQLSKDEFITPPPLMFSFETCEFFQISIEHRGAATSVFSLLLNSNDLLTGYEHLKFTNVFIISSIKSYQLFFQAKK